jgi:hypothetical protein
MNLKDYPTLHFHSALITVLHFKVTVWSSTISITCALKWVLIGP